MQEIKKLSPMHQRFIKFRNLCKVPTTYSVLTAAKDVGSDFKKIEKWCKSKEQFDEGVSDIEVCEYNCGINIGRAFMQDKLSKEEALKYLSENSIPATELRYFQERAREYDAKDRDVGKFLEKLRAKVNALESESVK